ncbi:DNA ligase 1-like [Chiloscyllium plagiosum]|uniref:DNA ligase 1-like n=1 Tax=Chiloscyllium plagiosum TaxID=36176 RepID=UPI001CB81B86|nr:DNA ligase 1-like [Chiloscyllium plagiosum]
MLGLGAMQPVSTGLRLYATLSLARGLNWGRSWSCSVVCDYPVSISFIDCSCDTFMPRTSLLTLAISIPIPKENGHCSDEEGAGVNIQGSPVELPNDGGAKELADSRDVELEGQGGSAQTGQEAQPQESDGEQGLEKELSAEKGKTHESERPKGPGEKSKNTLNSFFAPRKSSSSAAQEGDRSSQEQPGAGRDQGTPSSRGGHTLDSTGSGTISRFLNPTKADPVSELTNVYNPSKPQYHPVKDACWSQGQRVPYLALAQTFEKIESVSAR